MRIFPRSSIIPRGAKSDNDSKSAKMEVSLQVPLQVYSLSIPMLPVDLHRDAILRGLKTTQRLILVAPPGTGKSTHVPPMIPSEWGKVAVLQPRRIAARNLALRVSQEMGVVLGNEVGYSVRFEGKSRSDTRLLFQTYGVFFQKLLDDPSLTGIGVVVFDEFHERALECDAALAYCLRLQKQGRPDLKILVMSATLESESLARYLEPASLVEVASPLHPVEIRHQTPVQQEPVWEQAHRAARGLWAQGFDGSALVFMPGVGEIRRTCEAIAPLARKAGLTVHELHGSMDMEAQQRALAAPQQGPSVIVATNVAETSLTIPGINAVIDSGLQRVASYNAERDMDTLYLKSISQHSATQRAGRAGRLGPGICIRLWPSERERAMPLTLEPEIRRVDLTPLALRLHALAGEALHSAGPGAWRWLDDPPEALWSHALSQLQRITAIQARGITALGRELLQWPLHPVPAFALRTAKQTGDHLVYDLAAAMTAQFEAQARRNPQATSDLYALGRDLVRDPRDRQTDFEVRETWKRLRSMGPKGMPSSLADAAESAGVEMRARVTQCFLPAFIDRLASRQDQTQTFVLGDGRKGVADTQSVPASTQALLALELHETGGAGKSRQISIPVLLPVEAEMVEAIWPNEVRRGTESRWDESRGRQVVEERTTFRGLLLKRKAVDGAVKADATETLVEKLVSGEFTLPGFDEDAQQIVYRVKLAAKICPEMKMPALDEDDWRLIYHDMCEGKSSLKQLESVNVSEALRDYLGYSLWAWLEKEAPSGVKLPGGKRAKITYSESGQPEMAARLGDFVGLQGKTLILQKRVTVNYDILAPNYRTVQKTQDLTSFWENTYPEVKKELKRRYPRHPWP
jgi:ATP-dependent helicase HrpB